MTRTDPLDVLGLSLSRGACELYLVRHADAVPEMDVEHRAYDEYHAHPLSARGRAQAEAAGERFAQIGLAAAYASPIPRALETAHAIAARAGVEVFEDDALREVEIGTLDGTMTLRERLESLAMIAMRDGTWSAIAGTEPSSAVRARMRAALHAIAARHPGERVAVVSHAGSINAYLGDCASTQHDFLFPLANASISIVRVGRSRRLVMCANDTAHLRDVPARSR